MILHLDRLFFYSLNIPCLLVYDLFGVNNSAQEEAYIFVKAQLNVNILQKISSKHLHQSTSWSKISSSTHTCSSNRYALKHSAQQSIGTLHVGLMLATYLKYFLFPRLGLFILRLVHVARERMKRIWQMHVSSTCHGGPTATRGSYEAVKAFIRPAEQ